MTEELTVDRPRRGRPPASSRGEIEALAVDLFLHRGFTETTLAAITTAARVSKTSFFRYFPSKSAIIWSRFEDLVKELHRRFSAAALRPEEGPTMDVVLATIVDAAVNSVQSDPLWLSRLHVMHDSAELRAEAGEQWAAWRASQAGYIAVRHGLDPHGVVVSGITGGIWAGYTSRLQQWVDDPGDPQDLGPFLTEGLRDLAARLQTWLDQPVRTLPRA